ncbi:MAG: hypothetical protein EOM29_10865, partial [Bacteroidia bacterium]|nr:hypothetical protein [Bacteroidia bacterium]
MNYTEWQKYQKNQSTNIVKTGKSEPYIFGNTLTDLFANILYGSTKALEGIYDTGATAAGYIGGIFDENYRKNIQEKVKKDWTGQVIDLNKAQGGSLVNRMGDKGQMITRGVAQGFGQMLPAVGANFIIPGSGLATLGTSA